MTTTNCPAATFPVFSVDWTVLINNGVSAEIDARCIAPRPRTFAELALAERIVALRCWSHPAECIKPTPKAAPLTTKRTAKPAQKVAAKWYVRRPLRAEDNDACDHCGRCYKVGQTITDTDFGQFCTVACAAEMRTMMRETD